MVKVLRTPYCLRVEDNGWNVVRTTPTGWIMISGPFATMQDAEQEALRKWTAKSARVYA